MIAKLVLSEIFDEAEVVMEMALLQERELPEAGLVVFPSPGELLTTIKILDEGYACHDSFSMNLSHISTTPLSWIQLHRYIASGVDP